MGATTALVIGLAAGGLSALQSYQQSRAQNRQARYAASQAEAQAANLRNQAEITQVQGRVAGESIDRERDQLRREYADLQATNTANLGGLGVDLSSGSAMDVAMGNAQQYSEDIMANRYQRALSDWQYENQRGAQLASAQNYDNQASYYRSTVQGVGSSLLTAGLSGLTTGLGAYSAAGGLFGAGSAAAGSTASTVSTQTLSSHVWNPVNGIYGGMRI